MKILTLFLVAFALIAPSAFASLTDASNALVCDELYFVTSPDLNHWKGEIRGHCYYANYCYTHGGLHVHARMEPGAPDVVRVSFSGSARRVMDLCGHLYCERVKVGRGWYRGDILVPLGDLNAAKYGKFHYNTRDIFSPGHSQEDRDGQTSQCRWKAPWNVVDLRARSGD